MRRVLAASLAVLGLVCLPIVAQQEQVARPKITGIVYVRLYTANLHRSREFYRTVLGLGGDTMDCVAAGASCG